MFCSLITVSVQIIQEDSVKLQFLCGMSIFDSSLNYFWRHVRTGSSASSSL